MSHPSRDRGSASSERAEAYVWPPTSLRGPVSVLGGMMRLVVMPPKPGPMREAIANSIAREVKSYNVAAFCERLGLAPQGPDEDPHRSKAMYVLARLQERKLPELLELARAVLAEWDDDHLQALVDRTGVTGVAGELKNLIFGLYRPQAGDRAAGRSEQRRPDHEGRGELPHLRSATA
jgi:hypothetical protein